MRVGILIVYVLFFLCLYDICAQNASLLSDKKMDVDFDLMLKMTKSQHDDFCFASGSLNIIPIVAIYPEGKDDWGSGTYDYDHEFRVLLYNLQGETRFWSIKKPREDPNIEWLEKDGFYTGRYSLYKTKIESKLQSMISFAGAGKQLYFVYFFPSEINTRQPVIGYVENGKDVFIDSHLRKFNLLSLLESRYGSTDRYRELFNNYKKMMSYDPKGCSGGNSVRLISNTHVAKEIATCVEKFKFKRIWGHNIQDSLFRKSRKNTFVVTSYDGKHIIYLDMGRNERKLGDLQKMDNYCFEAIDFGDIYNSGNCNE